MTARSAAAVGEAVVHAKTSHSEIIETNGNGVWRTTASLSVTLAENLEAYALKTGRAKNEILITALTEYLRSMGLQPDKHPRLEVSY